MLISTLSMIAVIAGRRSADALGTDLLSETGNTTPTSHAMACDGERIKPAIYLRGMADFSPA